MGPVHLQNFARAVHLSRVFFPAQDLTASPSTPQNIQSPKNSSGATQTSAEQLGMHGAPAAEWSLN